jgi:CheY-like chemotaxis protein
MLRNLMANAFKCTAQGSMRIQGNEIAASGDSSMLEFVVPYSVIGIPEDEQKLLFQPFSPADALITRKFGGTGRQRCSDAGMDDFLTTPINYRLLVATLEKFGKAPGGCLL